MSVSKSELRMLTRSGCTMIPVYAKPNAKRSAVLGVKDGALHVAIAAPPNEGAANLELVAYVAKRLGVPKKQVSVDRGTTSRHKMLRVEGLTAEDVKRIFAQDLA